MKRNIIYVVIIVALAALIHKGCGQEKTEDSPRTAQNDPQNTPSTRTEGREEEADMSSPSPTIPQGDLLEIPVATTNRATGQEIRHTGYTVSFNSQWLIPNWVAYELTANETRGNLKREEGFYPDPAVRGRTSATSDYKRSGYDRGHMASAGDMKWSRKAMEECFYLSNICPQNHGLNTGLWNDLEQRIRKWARRGKSVYVVCRPIVTNPGKTIGYNNVVVPQAFFKVVCKKVGEEVETLGFIFPNEDCGGNIYNYSMSVDEVERRTGFDFFSLLPDAEEEASENKTDLRNWQ